MEDKNKNNEKLSNCPLCGSPAEFSSHKGFVRSKMSGEKYRYWRGYVKCSNVSLHQRHREFYDFYNSGCNLRSFDFSNPVRAAKEWNRLVKQIKEVQNENND